MINHRCIPRLPGLRLHYQGPQGADSRPEMEDGPSLQAPALLLARVPQIQKVRVDRWDEGKEKALLV